MLQLIIRKMFWTSFDHLWTNVLFSLIWIAFNLPFAGALATLAINHDYSVYWYIIFFNAFWLSPFAAGLSFAVLPQINEEEGSRDIRRFFRGVGKFWKRSLVIYALATLFQLVAVNGIVFYLGKYAEDGSFLVLVLCGLILLVLAFFLLMQCNMNTVLVKQDETVSKVFYKSFLLVLGNPGTYLFMAVLMVSVSIILVFSIIGLLLIFPVFHFLSWNIVVLALLSKYNPTITVKDDPRHFRNIFRPWS
jgi:hypothetical protein